MPTTNEQQRELLRSAYPESVRFKALRRLAQTAGIVRVLPRLYDLAREAESDWIALQANDLIADYLGIGTDASADDRPRHGYLAVTSTKPHSRLPHPPLRPPTS